MDNNTRMMEKYEKYLRIGDITRDFEGKTYYRIVSKNKVQSKGILVICVPNELFENGKVVKVVDENGFVFSLGNAVKYTFDGETPKWYSETKSVIVKDVINEKKIGEYLTAV